MLSSMSSTQTYTLMHKDVEVADLICTIDEHQFFSIEKIENVRNPEHMPYGIRINGEWNRSAFSDWLEIRSIPMWRDRSRLWDEYTEWGPNRYVMETMGFSLSDQYWFRPKGSSVSWKDGNFFENPFSDDLGKMLFEELEGAKEWKWDVREKLLEMKVDVRSPDLSTDGNLMKRWMAVDGEMCLLKHGYEPYFQEPYNEVVASNMMDLLGIEHAEYRLLERNGLVLSTCRNFVTPDTEYIGAYRALKSMKEERDEDDYGFFVRVCREYGVDAVPFLDRMITIDYLMMQSDRHPNNFGIIRDANTLEWLGPAPMFDCGGSLWFHTDDGDIGRPEARIKCRPFRSDFESQLKLVTSFDWLDIDKLDEIVPIVRSVFTEENGWHRPERTELIVKALEPRIERLKKVARAR